MAKTRVKATKCFARWFGDKNEYVDFQQFTNYGDGEIPASILPAKDYRDLLRDAKAWRASKQHKPDCCGTIGGHCDCRKSHKP